MNRKVVLCIILLISFLTIGFASITVNLIATGETTIGLNENNFNVHFTRALCDNNCIPTIEPNDEKSLTFTVPNLTNANDKVTLEYIVKNDSTQYDAEVSMQVDIPDAYLDYIWVEKTGFDFYPVNVYGKKQVAGSITVKLNQDVSEPISFEISMEINVSAISRTKAAEEHNNDDPATNPDFGYDSQEDASHLDNYGYARLDLGESTNVRLKRIAAIAEGASQETVNSIISTTTDTYIEAIIWSDNPPNDSQIVRYGQLGMTADSPTGVDFDGTTNETIVTDCPIYAWYDDGTIYIWAPDDSLDMHPHSERMFQGMTNLTNISALSHFNSEYVDTVRYIFKDTKISDFSPTDEWNFRNVRDTINQYIGNPPENNGYYYMCNNVYNGNHMNISYPAGIWDEYGTYHPRYYEIYGDLNGDGEITSDDFWLLFDFLNGNIGTLNGCTHDGLCGDVNSDGVVDQTDLDILQLLY